MNTSIRNVISSILLLAASLLVVGCNTTRGVGEDLEEAGEEIQDAAK